MTDTQQNDDQPTGSGNAYDGFLPAAPDAMAEFATRRERLSEAVQELSVLAGTSAKKPIAKLEKDLESFEPAVTFLGQVKSGKTTLVNAMAGWPDLLPADVNPWTSVVTSVHLRPGPERVPGNARFQLMKENFEFLSKADIVS